MEKVMRDLIAKLRAKIMGILASPSRTLDPTTRKDLEEQVADIDRKLDGKEKI